MEMLYLNPRRLVKYVAEEMIIWFIWTLGEVNSIIAFKNVKFHLAAMFVFTMG